MAWKETYASHYDPAPGGVVDADESYEENAQRELEEEMGIPLGQSLSERFDFLYEDELTRVWGRLFECGFSGPFKLQESEVDSVEWVPIAELRSFMAERPICPDSKMALERWLTDRGL